MDSNTQAQIASMVNNNLQTALANLIQSTIDGAKQAGQFLKEQIPDVIRQLLMWKMTEAIIMSIVCLIVLIVSLLLLKKCIRELKVVGNDDIMIAYIFGCIASAAGIILGCSFLVVNLKTAIMIGVAPKIYLIQYSVDLIKSMSGN